MQWVLFIWKRKTVPYDIKAYIKKAIFFIVLLVVIFIGRSGKTIKNVKEIWYIIKLCVTVIGRILRHSPDKAVVVISWVHKQWSFYCLHFVKNIKHRFCFNNILNFSKVFITNIIKISQKYYFYIKPISKYFQFWRNEFRFVRVSNTFSLIF